MWHVECAPRVHLPLLWMGQPTNKSSFCRLLLNLVISACLCQRNSISTL